jgi:hypothetical protein
LGPTLKDVYYNDATGGEIATVGGYKTHYFKSGSGVFVPKFTGVVEVLAVGGGGSGATRYGGGGGAGGMVYNPAYPVVAGAEYIVKVGAGGARVTAAAAGLSGSPSQFGSIVAMGGGGGGNEPLANGKNGGSGGGASYGASGPFAGSGISGQGYQGGTGVSGGSYTSGGGGGAGGGGGNATDRKSGV